MSNLPPPVLTLPPTTTIQPERLRNLVVALIFASAVCFGMLAVRALVSSKVESLGFFGNLLLAWIPLLLAWAICCLLDQGAIASDRRGSTLGVLEAISPRALQPRVGGSAGNGGRELRTARPWMIAALFILWFLFFPNAPYIVTDLVHLKTRPPVPRWFDYILMIEHAITGLFLMYLSLTLLHAPVRERWGATRGWLFVFTMLSAASLGVYVGRFFRWNSWDVILRPGKPARDLGRFFQEDTVIQTLFFCSAFLALLAMVYLVLHALAHLHARDSREDV